MRRHSLGLCGLVLCIVLAACASSKLVHNRPLFYRTSSELYSGDCLALARASAGGDVVRINKLVESGVDVDCRGAYGVTPLYWAIMSRTASYDGLQQLLAIGADPNAFISSGEAMLHLAVMRGDSRVIRILVDHGADVNLRDATKGRTPIYEIGFGLIGDPLSVLRELIAAGADVNARSQVGYTPLLELASGFQFEAVEILLAHGADPLATSKNGVGLCDVMAVAARGGLSSSSKEHDAYVRLQSKIDCSKKNGRDSAT